MTASWAAGSVSAGRADSLGQVSGTAAGRPAAPAATPVQMQASVLLSAVVLVATLGAQPGHGQRWKLDDGKVVFERGKPEKPRTAPKSASNGHYGMFYSFLDPLLASRRFSWQQSEAICNFHGMTLASLQDDRKHFKVARLMGVLKVDGVWTSGARSQYDFYWGLGEPVSYSRFKGWSRTGAVGRGQPDNAGGDEHCLAVLNNAFGDGITWHDVACDRRMAFVCEPPPDD
ncbi:lectin-like isoform X2 [Amphibalanus amphitrite]|uniref:lectin-like isoform X2 n=1 Tax=Amphibalanus amphitrite TaxID=1232801 RepID=UPI001C926694|nr:lectin-like isoform X2 [Amphibalanus amphitrite]